MTIPADHFDGYANPMRRIRWALLLMIWGGGARAATATAPPVDPCLWANNPGLTVDRAHAWLSRYLCVPSRWVDGFFSDPVRDPDRRAGSLVRVTEQQQWRDDGNGGANTHVSARVRLPGAQRRLSLLFVSRDPDEENRADLAHTLAASQQNDTGSRGALRWALQQARSYNLDFDVGLHSGLHAFTQVRYQQLYPLSGKDLWLRYTQRLYWQDPEGWGSRSLFELNRTLSPRRAIRAYQEVRYTEQYNQQGQGLLLLQGVNLFQRLGDRSAFSLGLATDAHTHPDLVMDDYRVSLLYRANIWRPWLFYEVEPFVLWARNEGFTTVRGFILRLEVQFGDPGI